MSLHSIPIFKYPRTPHLEGSRLQPGDDDREQIPLAQLAGQHAVIEEKLDGANAAVSFSEDGELLLQSRGHYLAGGGGERQFTLFKQWARAHEARLMERLEDRYVMYGEWLYAKHSVWYDRLPHYFCEFDLYDRRTQCFLSTRRRRELLAGSPVLSVPVLYDGPMPAARKVLEGWVRPSLAKSEGWERHFEDAVLREGWPLDLCWRQTDRSILSEGLYVKIENADEVCGRFKWVRRDFVQTILDSGSHHRRRPLLPNVLVPGADLFAPAPTVHWSLKG